MRNLLGITWARARPGESIQKRNFSDCLLLALFLGSVQLPWVVGDSGHDAGGGIGVAAKRAVLRAMQEARVEGRRPFRRSDAATR